MKSWAQKDDLVQAVLDLVDQKISKDQRAPLQKFIKSFYQNASPEDILERSVEILYGAALSVWKFSAKRVPGEVKCRVFNPTIDEHGWHTSHTIVQIINDDMPFLVDSVTGNLVHDGINVHFIVHPILSFERTPEGERQPDGAKNKDKNLISCRESVIHLEIDSKTAPEIVKSLATKLSDVLQDVRAAVVDWKPMLSKMDSALESLKKSPSSIDSGKAREAFAFMEWLRDDNFTLLGYREFDHSGPTPKAIESSGLGILRDPGVHVFRGTDGMVAVSQEISHFLKQPDPIIITKANVKSTVHRVTHMDYVGVKKFDKDGKLYGELRFVGLFTSVAYSRRPQEIPFLRKKVEHVINNSRFESNSHDGKALIHILENFPRDELFQISDDELLNTAMGILHLQERPQPKVFVRADKFERFVSALVYIPRELYASGLREKFERILCEAYNGEISTRSAQLSNDVIARWHLIIRTRPGHVLSPNLADLNARIVEAARRWQDNLRDELAEQYGEEKGNALLEKYSGSFSGIYREVFSAKIAVLDIDKLEELAHPEDVRFSFYRLAEDPDDAVRLKIYHASRVIPLSDCLPMLENLGLKVIEEFGYSLEEGETDAPSGCIHSFYLVDPRGGELELSGVKARLEEALTDIWSGSIENDGFNALVMLAGLTARQVVVLRTYTKYLRQLGLSYSEEYMRDCLIQHAEIACQLVLLFETYFDPEIDNDGRASKVDEIVGDISTGLDDVQSLDQDRILRNYLNVAQASLRTNYYQLDEQGTHKSYLSIKIRSSEVEEAPLPRPYAEIFVYSPRVEGVHLRGGPVARGGLRWSDRREDFRTEVLGLAKAQQVKNAVIVPVGAKGGFVPKNLPVGTDREAIMAEGIACYRIFISALLDITDNLTESGVVTPQNVIRRDEDDPYLVVAADKGTATFSDIANGIARDYGFWLDDAFASGGSQGYDHKKMGITARGAWVSVQRHFREIGIDVQSTPFTVIGIGDMSGDVFGNGMLCSPCIKLTAAFDHRDIFLDPDPDPAKSFRERQRLFALPRSSWQDYDTKLISKGGGVFPRSLKSIPLSAEIKAMLGLEEDKVSPITLIRAILKSEADLLWVGGIGTYVKSSEQGNQEAGDRANDAIRIDGKELRVNVVGEGGNLGMTQKGRIEYALNGGRLNTDAVDNSAGVDCSDHEVNIKIPLNRLLLAGKISEDQRNRLLVEMTEDVSRLVLEDNYLQTQAISLAQAAGVKQLEAHRRLIITLEKEKLLNRRLEYLPDEEEIADRALAKKSLTRPELSVLIAYAKMSLNGALISSELIDDPYFEDSLIDDFPPQLGQEYGDSLKNHQLRREIIATILSNTVINRAGLTFISTVQEETGVTAAEVVHGFVAAREVFGLNAIWQGIDDLDYQVPSAIQILMHLEVIDFARRQTIWFVRNSSPVLGIEAVVERHAVGVAHLKSCLGDILGEYEKGILKKKIDMFTEQGIKKELASTVAGLESMGAACDICEVASKLEKPVSEVARAYFEIGAATGLDWLHSNAEMMTIDDHWERLATTAITEDVVEQQRCLTRRALAAHPEKSGADAADTWISDNQVSLKRARQVISELHGAGALTVAKLGYAARHIRSVFLRDAA